MFRKSVVYLFLIILFLVASCRATRLPVPTSNQSGFTERYVETYKDLAISEMNRTGVPASITLAQGMIESDYGRSSLAVRANNHFGIKCHTDWTGRKFYQDDDRRNECFRNYNNPEESFRDHSDFLVSGSRYDFLFDLDVQDYVSWARGLKKAGYATNPDYAEMLIRKIEEFNLNQYDRPNSGGRKEYTAGDSKQIVDKAQNSDSNIPPGYVTEPAQSIGTSRILVRNRINYIVVKESDTFESLLEEFQLLRFELQKYNELPDNYVIIPGQILYIQPKRDKAEVGSDFYTFKEGDTIYNVSQQYGVKLKNILEMNRLKEGEEPVAGQKIWLRSIKP